jgi:hypothetical protein
VLTEAGQLLLPRAWSVLEAAAGVADAVRPVRSLTGGTVSFGTFSSAHHFFPGDAGDDPDGCRAAAQDIVAGWRTTFPVSW